MDEKPRIESCIYCASDEARYDDAAIATLEAELRELRRKAWNWDEARAIVAQRKHQGMIADALKTFVAGDGDAEWETKAHMGEE